MITMGLTSVAETYKFIKQFHFCAGLGIDPYDRLTFSDTDKIRLDPNDCSVKLKRNEYGKFYNDTDIWFRTWVTNPKAVRKLLTIQTLPNLQPEYCEIYLRINNGTDDLYWDGADWSVAGANDWNTEIEINEHLEEFPILPDRQFAVTVNLRTLDPYRDVTPYISEIRVLTEMHIDYIEDIILRSLMPMIENGINATSNYAAIPSFTTDVSEIDFTQYRKNTPYNIIDVDRVYDLTDDIDLLYNIVDSYNVNTGVITLSSPLPSGHRPLIVFRYTPEVVYIEHQDWIEVNKIPSLILQRLDVPTSQSYGLTARESIVDKGTYDATIIQTPLRASMEFRLHGITSNTVDQMRLMSNTLKFFDQNKLIRSIGLDEYYRLYLDKEFRDLSNPGKSDERVFWTKFVIKDIRMPFVSESAKAVRSLKLNFKEVATSHEDPVKGGSRLVVSRNTDGAPIVFTETVEKTL